MEFVTLRSYRSSVGPAADRTSVLVRREAMWTHREAGHVRTEAELGAMLPPAKERRGLLEPPEAGRGGKDAPQRLRRKRGPADTLILNVQPLEVREETSVG